MPKRKREALSLLSLPEDALSQMLSWLATSDLLFSIRGVCKQLRQIVYSYPEVWQCAFKLDINEGLEGKRNHDLTRKWATTAENKGGCTPSLARLLFSRISHLHLNSLVCSGLRLLPPDSLTSISYEELLSRGDGEPTFDPSYPTEQFGPCPLDLKILWHYALPQLEKLQLAMPEILRNEEEQRVSLPLAAEGSFPKLRELSTMGYAIDDAVLEVKGKLAFFAPNLEALSITNKEVSTEDSTWVPTSQGLANMMIAFPRLNTFQLNVSYSLSDELEQKARIRRAYVEQHGYWPPANATTEANLWESVSRERLGRAQDRFAAFLDLLNHPRLQRLTWRPEWTLPNISGNPFPEMAWNTFWGESIRELTLLGVDFSSIHALPENSLPKLTNLNLEGDAQYSEKVDLSDYICLQICGKNDPDCENWSLGLRGEREARKKVYWHPKWRNLRLKDSKCIHADQMRAVTSQHLQGILLACPSLEALSCPDLYLTDLKSLETHLKHDLEINIFTPTLLTTRPKLQAGVSCCKIVGEEELTQKIKQRVTFLPRMWKCKFSVCGTPEITWDGERSKMTISFEFH